MFLPRRSRQIIALLVSTLVLTVFSSTAALAKTLYVDAINGNDTVTYINNNEANPWRTLGRAVWGNAARGTPRTSEAAQAGDVVVVASGTYTTTYQSGLRYEPIYNPANQGVWNSSTNTCTSTITFRAATQYAVTLTSPTTGGESPVIGMYRRNCIIWDGFTINEANNLTPGDGGIASIWASNGGQILNSDLTGAYKTQSDANNHNIVRLESVSHGVVKNNKLHGATGNSSSNDSGITTYNCAYCLIENNDIYDNSTGIYYKGDSTDPSRAPRQSNITIRYNRVYSNGGVGMLLLGSADSTTNINRVYQNLLYNNASACFELIPIVGTYNHKIVNNTCYTATTQYAGLWVDVTAIGYGNSIRNNIFVNFTEVIGAATVSTQPPTYFEIDYNLYHQVTRWAFNGLTYSTLSAWRTSLGGCPSPTVGRDCGSLTGNPLFVNTAANNFRLQANSPARNAGIDALDLDGDGRTDDPIHLGVYITGNETIGILSNATPPSPPTGLEVVP